MYLEKYDLSGRVAVVTGGGRNIGLACVQALAEANAKVVIAEVDADVGAAGMDELSKAGITAELRILDVTKPDAVTEVADQIVGDHDRVDILVCNAGICFHTPCEEIPDDQWRQVMDLNVNGVYWCCRAFGRSSSACRC